MENVMEHVKHETPSFNSRSEFFTCHSKYTIHEMLEKFCAVKFRNDFDSNRYQ